MLARLLPRFGRGSRHSASELTEREREVLALVAEGLSNAAIAERLVVSVHTVRNHIASLSAKLGAHSKLEALSIAAPPGAAPRSLSGLPPSCEPLRVVDRCYPRWTLVPHASTRPGQRPYGPPRHGSGSER